MYNLSIKILVNSNNVLETNMKDAMGILIYAITNKKNNMMDLWKVIKIASISTLYKIFGISKIILFFLKRLAVLDI